MICQGAEGKIFETVFLNQPAICKVRQRKRYRVSELDDRINKQRLLQEARCIAKCKRFGVPAPWLVH
jgi:TP53 regulating kinase-like protein